MLPVAPPSPAAETQRKRDERRVAAALSTLPPAQRRTFELAYFEGLSSSEIAARLQLAVGTVKSRMARALGCLREALVPDLETQT